MCQNNLMKSLNYQNRPGISQIFMHFCIINMQPGNPAKNERRRALFQKKSLTSLSTFVVVFHLAAL